MRRVGVGLVRLEGGPQDRLWGRLWGRLWDRLRDKVRLWYRDRLWDRLAWPVQEDLKCDE